MIQDSVFYFMLIVHFLADFCLQTVDQALNKSTDVRHLTRHVLTYSLVWLVVAYAMFGSYEKALIFASITFITHWPTDYITSRLGKPFWDKKDYHTGFVVVGADQIAHYIQLIETYKLLA